MKLSTQTLRSGTVYKQNPKQPQAHHVARTILASIFGTIALTLILTSILVVWLNRTLTDTPSYASTVVPLANDPDIQNFIAAKATDAILKNGPSDDVAAAVLPAAKAAGKTPLELQAALKTTVSSGVLQVVRSQDFRLLWQSTNLSAHAQLVSQIKDGADHLTLDLSPLISGVTSELKTTQLAPVSDQIVLPQDAGKLTLSGGVVGKIQNYYRIVQTATWVLIGAAVLATGLCVVVSVDHVRTLRRILMGTGVTSLVGALLLQAPALIHLKGANPVEQKAAVALAAALFHNLQLALIIIGVACVALALGSKLYSHYRRRSARI